eukprot:360772-Chlamydomonas_euryale.AAC.5
MPADVWASMIPSQLIAVEPWHASQLQLPDLDGRPDSRVIRFIKSESQRTDSIRRCLCGKQATKGSLPGQRLRSRKQTWGSQQSQLMTLDPYTHQLLPLHPHWLQIALFHIGIPSGPWHVGFAACKSDSAPGGART